jgi:hypothetical protein
MVELKPGEFIQRFDGSRMSDRAARNDRAARGSYLFSLWISNRDAKDDNNKSFFIREPIEPGRKMQIASYLEGPHDLGLTLGSLWSSVEINEMKKGADFARKGLLGAKIRFPQALLFKPKSWSESTWADAKWMARRITSITEGEIREAAAASGWPDFMQEALVYRIVDRRNRIAELFELTENLDRYPAVTPTIAVALGTAADISGAERKYGLPDGALSSELAAIGVVPGYAEALVSKGRVTHCRKSALIRLLVHHRYPSGLDHRYERTRDTHPCCTE